MGFIRDIKTIKDNVKEVKESLNDVTKELFYKAQKYDDLLKYLKSLKIKVKQVSLFLTEDYRYDVKVEYQIPDVVLQTNKSNDYKNELFTAINMLNLISISDMEKISKKIKEAKEKNGE